MLGLVIGDPGGIGPEVCVKAIAQTWKMGLRNFVMIGSHDVLKRESVLVGLNPPLRVVDSAEQARQTLGDAIPVLDDGSSSGSFPVGGPSAEAGAATHRWIARAIDLAESGGIDGLLVAPVDTTSFDLAGIDWLPQFEPEDCFLLRTTGKLRTIPIAEHVQMKDVPGTVRRERVLQVILLIGEQMRRWGIAQPRIAVAGLNPHCMGEEEAREITPAIQEARSAGFDVTGPVSPDAVFRHGLMGKFDVIVTMYHDQGQIAVKTVGLEDACTIFCGLPYLRVGIPHGSAMDIAGTGTAQHATTLMALKTAASLANGRGLQDWR